MCGRFTLYNKKKVADKIGFDIKPNYNIVPSHDILILTPKPILFYWGLSPTWANKPMNLINARIETLKEKPAFKKTKPCIVVSNGWYEWKKSNNSKKIPFFIHDDNKIIYFAGVYNEIGCSIITKEASPSLANIHHRQPLILRKKERLCWIREFEIKYTYEPQKLQFHRVGNYVNSPKNNDPKCIDAI